MKIAKILIVDDDLVYLNELSDALRSLDHVVECASSADEAKIWLRDMAFDITICDTIMAGGGALSLLHDIRSRDPDFPFIAITGRPAVASSPLFQNGMMEANAKLEKSATLFEIDQLVRSLTK